MKSLLEQFRARERFFLIPPVINGLNVSRRAHSRSPPTRQPRSSVSPLINQTHSFFLFLASTVLNFSFHGLKRAVLYSDSELSNLQSEIKRLLSPPPSLCTLTCLLPFPPSFLLSLLYLPPSASSLPFVSAAFTKSFRLAEILTGFSRQPQISQPPPPPFGDLIRGGV